jgi:hypothetical protein
VDRVLEGLKALQARVNGRPRQQRPTDALMNEHEVAALLAVSVRTVRHWRLIRRGPPFLKIGACVRYRPDAVREWLSTSQ